MTLSQRIMLVLVTIGAAITLTAPPAQAIDTLLFGQLQAYDVMLRSDKKTVTSAKIVFTNDEQSDQKEFTFTVPDNIKVSAMTVYQALPPSSDRSACANKTYETYSDWLNRTKSKGTSSQLQQQYEQDQKCQLTEEDQDAYDFSGYIASSQYGDIYSTNRTSDAIKFSKLTPAVKGSTYTVSLNRAVKTQQRGAVLISYLGDGFTSEFAGNYNYNYKTLIVKDSVKKVDVTINLDDDLYAKGTKARTTAAQPAANDTPSTDNGISSGASSAQGRMQNYSDSYVSTTIYRSGKNLLPGDTFAVSGSFSDSYWKLYMGEIGTALLIGAAFVAGILFWHKKRNQRIPKKSENEDTLQTEKQSKHADRVSDSASHTQVASLLDKPLNLKIATVVAGLATAATFAIVILSETIANMPSGYNSNPYETEGIARGLITTIAIFYVAFVAPLFATMKHGQSTVFAWFTIELIFVAISIVVMTSLMPM